MHERNRNTSTLSARIYERIPRIRTAMAVTPYFYVLLGIFSELAPVSDNLKSRIEAIDNLEVLALLTKKQQEQRLSRHSSSILLHKTTSTSISK